MNYLYGTSFSTTRFQLRSADEAGLSGEQHGLYTILWNRGADTNIHIDGIETPCQHEQILTLTPMQHFRIPAPAGDLLLLQFNDGFYCVEQHDAEVSCVGFLFYGSSEVGNVRLDAAEQQRFNVMLEMLVEEFQNRDHIQGEMLKMLLKRFIIKCVRLGREQTQSDGADDQKFDTVRRFNVLVAKHFRAEHGVAFYAGELAKSPKTLAHIFAQCRQPAPLAVIHAKLYHEAARQLKLTTKSVKEVAYELGFADVQSFSRFFKMRAGITPSAARGNRQIANNTGSIDNR